MGNWSGEGAWVVADHVFSLSEGSQLYEYRIDRILGHGGFGITYLAEDTLLQEPVAIKEFLPNELAVRDSTTPSSQRARTSRKSSSGGCRPS